MHKLVLLRHGESTWNLENRFTGWTDVDLSPKGVEEATAGAKLLKEGGYVFDVAHTSLLRRAIRTLWITLEGMDLMWIPVKKTWRLNERHYGALQGLNKAETAKKFGDEQVKIWRRAYATPPPPLTPDDERHAGRDPRYAGLTKDLAAPHRVAQGHGGPLPAVLARRDRAGPQGRQARADRRPRQQPARAREAPRRHLRGRDRRPQHPDRHPPRLRARPTSSRRSATTTSAIPRPRRRRRRRSANQSKAK